MRARSLLRRSPWLTRIAVGLVVALVASGVGWLVTGRHAARPTSCAARAGHGSVPLSVSQAGIAATIAAVAARRDLPTRAVTIAYAAALQESKLSNPAYGDRDSVGVFQQRPSQGWGTVRQIMDPVYAAGRFFSALVAVSGYQSMPVYAAAQAVQRSADGYAYDQYADVAAQLADTFSGVRPHALSCYYASPMGKPRLAAAVGSLTHAFGPLPSQGAVTARAASPGTPSSDPAVGVVVPGSSEGWAVAAWLISHAGRYGIGHVQYQGYLWRPAAGTGGWVRQQGRAAATTVVLFG